LNSTNECVICGIIHSILYLKTEYFPNKQRKTMNSKIYILCLLICTTSISISVFAGGDVKTNEGDIEKTFIINNTRIADETYQKELRETKGWKQFTTKHPGWRVEFNEENRKPHRAYGKSIATNGSTYEACAENFIAQELGEFNIPFGDLYVTGKSLSTKHCYINYGQRYNGVKVLFSRMVVKMTKDRRVIMFGADVYDDINININPTLGPTQAAAAAKVGIDETILSTEVNKDLFILPIPEFRKYNYRLVYEVMVEAIGGEIPASYRTWVDAENGEVLYRDNQVKFHTPHPTAPPPPPPAPIEVDITATIYPTYSYNPSATGVLPNMRIRINNVNYYTDAAGHLTTAINTGTNGQFYLDGLWADVETNNQTPTFTTALIAGANTETFDSDANIKELTAYYHVNIIHDFVKQEIPTFTGMDFQLTTNVDVSGTCNAFYNGSSINFYAPGGGCLSYATVADVVYHEYGHGINDNFYQDQGSFFNNGAMGEAYGDVWAFAITLDPILGRGGNDTDPNDYIRRYDINPKVYPEDIVGEVHADGEILAGAWWDLYLLMGNMDTVMYLFAEAYYGVQAVAANGNEGQAFRDVLLDVLEADDDDGNINNGTPNGTAICDAFGQHGITMVSNATLSHTELTAAVTGSPITINTTLNIGSTTYLGGVKLFYKIENGSWVTVNMTDIGSNNYTADIPSQAEGTIVSYYIGVEDNICGYLSSVVPTGASATDPNLPYMILVGFDLESTNDFDFNNFPGSWTYGFPMPIDSATTGMWAEEVPVGMIIDGYDFAPTTQHTPGGFVCAVTQLNTSSTGSAGEFDVDGGRSTLQSPVIDITGHLNPVVSYYRWFSNDPPTSANPGNDPWYVEVTDDGNTWVPVEFTYVSDNSWRRFAFRVSDYVNQTANFQMKFMVSDSIITSIGPPGCGTSPFCGGSLVEAALDDIEIWSQQIGGLTATITSTTNITCNGSTDGQATASGVGGTSPYTFAWNTSPVQNTAIATGLAAGTYECILTDAGGGADTVSVTITEPAAIVVTTGSTIANCEASIATATASLTGGTGPFTYAWDDAMLQSTAAAINLGAGTYVILVTDAMGCTGTATETVTSTPAVTAVTASNPPSSCGATDGQASVSASGTPPYTYSWSTTPVQTNSTANNLAAGSYSVLVTDGNGCTVTELEVLSDPGAGTFSISSSANIACFGGNEGSATADITGTAGPYIYAWDDPGTQTNATATGLVAGTYVVTLVDGGGCTYAESVTITQPTAALSVGTPVVTDVTVFGGNDGSAAVFPSGGTTPYTYTWSTTPVQNTAIANGLSADTYTIDLADANGCTSSAIVTVNEPAGVGISSTEDLVGISVYPNPSSYEFFIEISLKDRSDLQIRMTNTVGQTVYSEQKSGMQAGEHRLTINASEMGIGIYLLSITAGDKIYYEKVVLSR